MGHFALVFFVDQLALARHTDKSGPRDRELFVRNLPLSDMSHNQIKEYFETFGRVESMAFIGDPYTDEPNGEGYVRFVNHFGAKNCLDDLTQDHEAEPTDLIGSWSQSERMLQRKANCHRFNYIVELVGETNGASLERARQDMNLKRLWVTGESLRQKDKLAPNLDIKQLQFVGRFVEESQVERFREYLMRYVERTHTRIEHRLLKRKRKAMST